VLIGYNEHYVLIDTTPDFREQALREHITQLDAVLYTHTHADHILGIDDLRPLTYRHKPGKLPLYATPRNCEFLRNMFRYIFEPKYKFGGLPQVELHPIEGPVELFGARFEPLTVIHGETRSSDSVSDRPPTSPITARSPPKHWRTYAASTFCFWTRCVTRRIPRIRPSSSR